LGSLDGVESVLGSLEGYELGSLDGLELGLSSLDGSELSVLGSLDEVDFLIVLSWTRSYWYNSLCASVESTSCN